MLENNTEIVLFIMYATSRCRIIITEASCHCCVGTMFYIIWRNLNKGGVRRVWPNFFFFFVKQVLLTYSVISTRYKDLLSVSFNSILKQTLTQHGHLFFCLAHSSMLLVIAFAMVLHISFYLSKFVQSDPMRTCNDRFDETVS